MSFGFGSWIPASLIIFTRAFSRSFSFFRLLLKSFSRSLRLFFISRASSINILFGLPSLLPHPSFCACRIILLTTFRNSVSVRVTTGLRICPIAISAGGRKSHIWFCCFWMLKISFTAVENGFWFSRIYGRSFSRAALLYIAQPFSRNVAATVCASVAVNWKTFINRLAKASSRSNWRISFTRSSCCFSDIASQRSGRAFRSRAAVTFPRIFVSPPSARLIFTFRFRPRSDLISVKVSDSFNSSSFASKSSSSGISSCQ